MMPGDERDDVGSPDDGRGQAKPPCFCAGCEVLRKWAAEEIARAFDATQLYGVREEP